MAAPMLRRWFPNTRDRLDALRATYWFLPTMMLAGGALLATIMVALDRSGWLPEPSEDSWYHSGDPASARSLLSTLAGSMITVAGLVFSMTTVSLTVASSQYGPHLLRNFMRDRGHQVVLGTYTATFLYCLLIQRVIGNEPSGAGVPHWSITVALGLAVANLVVLVYFIHHVASSIRISNVVRVVAGELDETVQSLYPIRIVDDEELPAQPDSPPGIEGTPAALVRSSRFGYLRSIDIEGLLRLAVAHELVIRLRVRQGEFIHEEATLLSVQPEERVDEKLAASLRGHLVIGETRTAFQDVRFSFEQLEGVALRALSPGINDPQTAVTCIHRLGEGVARLAGRTMPSGWHCDEAGRLRVVAEPLGFADILVSAFDRIRFHGAEHTSVVRALLETLDAISARTTVASRRALIERCREAVHASASNARKSNPDLAPMYSFAGENAEEPTEPTPESEDS